MKRTTVYLDELTDLELARLAKQQERSKAELIREALGAYTENARRAARPVPDWIGLGNSRGKRVAERDEELLKEGLAEAYERLKDVPA